ncbi:hypothetical protein [Pseudobacteriovorax antillogorgiicola]|uniref:Uncharacterized protein n=1 Tax=Pseudobacteriovorax antillogorgiicola TaxID=1513793 RepID=A0A1Y6BKB3_9BACT|nr:hypothetical protein [Pseudobacteriovorax antillogorgiicola]TCS56269.1 hypothetical protein EDD56_10491 [Pseudobacteriovorax antillogorgiicola]SMF07794.1 hypothetical protein SAMN06296036_104242 [Pseudobacteriovorax antillogorgiicola]
MNSLSMSIACLSCAGILAYSSVKNIDNTVTIREPDRTLKVRLDDKPRIDKAVEFLGKVQKRLARGIANAAEREGLSLSTRKNDPKLRNTISFDLTIKPKRESCIIGSLDLMSLHSKYVGSDEFLLTLEDLSNEAQFKIVHKTSLSELMKGKAFEFRLPRRQKLSQYGIFICSLGKGQTCSDHAKGGMIDTFHEHRLVKQKGRKYSGLDRIFAFQHLLVQDKKIRVTNQKAGPKLFAMLSRSLPEQERIRQQGAINLSEKIQKKTSPTDIEIEDGTVTMGLGYHKPGCFL